MREIVTFLQRLARDAGNIMMHYRNQPYEVYHKADRTLVTEVDLKISQMVCEAVSTTYPDAGLLTEETLGRMISPHRYGFIIDELDGTYSYSKGRSGFTFQCAYYEDFYELKLGLIYDPIRDILLYGIKGEGVWLEQDGKLEQIQVPAECCWDELRYAHHRSFMSETIMRMYNGLGIDRSRIISTGGVGSKSIDFVHQKVDAMIALNRKIAAWDWAPGKVIMEELGFHVGYLTGEPLTINQPASDFAFGYLVCPKVHHARFLEELKWIIDKVTPPERWKKK